MKIVQKMEEENEMKIEMKEIPSTDNKEIPSTDNKEIPISNEVSEVTTDQPDVLVSPREQ